jgi:CheY-like chemotaxis protein
LAAMRVLVAGTADAIDAVRKALQHDVAHVVAAHSVREALERCAQEDFDVVACSVRFDESRMFEFLQALMERSPPCSARIVSFRSTGAPLTPSLRNAIRQALEALGVERFIDLPQIERHYDAAAASETLRKMVLDERFSPPAPAEE